MNHALRRISLACLVMFVLLLANANYVQVFEAASFANDPGNARTFDQQFSYERGPIVTADDVPIARSKPLKGNPNGYKFLRVYPQGPVYAPITGFSSLYNQTGIEGAENSFLAGTAPQLSVHNLINMASGKPRQGATVQLTINSKTQQAAYQALKDSHLPSAVVALNPSTGAILAMATYPSYNPNQIAILSKQSTTNYDNLNRKASQPLVNRAIGAQFHPGSTFKIITASTALSTGDYTPQTAINAPTNLRFPGVTAPLINFDNEPCGDGSGKAPMIVAFYESCNTAFGSLGDKVGDSALRREAAKFGFDDPNLQIPLGVLPSTTQFTDQQDLTAFSAIGQYSDLATPLQEAMLSAAIANRGTLMKPYLVANVRAPDSLPLTTTTPSVFSHPVTPRVAGEVAQMMDQVVNNPGGTAHNIVGAEQQGFSLFAKTGTAQNGTGNGNLDDSVFTCYASVNNVPQIAVGVIVAHGGLGADAAAPVAVNTIEAYLRSMGKIR